MSTSLKARPRSAGTLSPWGSLPERMRVLFVTTPNRTGGWLAEAFAADSAAEILVEEVVGVSRGLARIRDEKYDALLLSHEPGELDALDFAEGLRASGSDEPLIVLGVQSEQEMMAVCFEVGADAYVCVNTVTTRSLIWVVARAVERHQLIRENSHLDYTERHRLQLEQEEAQRLLAEQRSMLEDLAQNRRHLTCRRSAGEGDLSLPDELVGHYGDLLRAYVIMGSGNLGKEMCGLANLLAAAGISAQQTMRLHVRVLEALVRGLGNRSTRHVMTRADLLILEVMVHLAENYRRQALDRKHPPHQQMLPGFDAA